jgi:hypothetical protein
MIMNNESVFIFHNIVLRTRCVKVFFIFSSGSPEKDLSRQLEERLEGLAALQKTADVLSKPTD